MQKEKEKYNNYKQFNQNSIQFLYLVIRTLALMEVQMTLTAAPSGNWLLHITRRDNPVNSKPFPY